MLSFENNQIDDLIAVKDSVIYHYTSFSVLPEFLKEKAELYCTTTEVLNDPSEVRIGSEMFVNYLSVNKKIVAQRSETLKKHVLESIEGRVIDTWVMSLSSCGDDLSQWRGYVPGLQGGYAIGFNVKKLLLALSDITVAARSDKTLSIPYLTKCWYKESASENIESLFASQYAKYKSEFDRYAGASAAELNDDVIRPVVATIILTSGLIKEEAFKSENEARIILVPQENAYSRIKMLGGKARLPIGFEMCDKRVCECIDEIIVSPHGNRAALMSQVNWLKRKCGGGFEVRESSIPYDPSR